MNSGNAIAHYRITAKLGEGGMGEVWRASDTKLNRDVAIKILPEAFAQDADRMARFEREAQVLASLNHPNIAAIYGVEERALIMELVEGQPLRGPLPVQTVLNYARQIAEALEYAHERGIVHRDLKPANIKVTPEGRVKVLDFGLAKAVSNEASAGNPEFSPTLTMRATLAGAILGTAAYMSPEQARGQDVDKRADIWAYGVVLFEMLTGQQIFLSQTISDTLASVLKDEPAWNSLPPETPATLRRLLRRCLERDRKNRLHDIGDARLEIDDTLSAREDTKSLVSPKQAHGSRRVWIGLPIVCIAVALGLGALLVRRGSPPEIAAQLSVLPPENATIVDRVSVSPDGRTLAFVAATNTSRPRIYLRSLDTAKPRLLNGTEGAGTPFWSPDGRFLAFTTNRTNKLVKVSVSGGPPQTLCDSDSTASGTWGLDGTILIGRLGDGLFRVSANDGSVTRLTTPDASRKERRHTSPQFFPGSRQFLYVAASDEPATSMLYAASLDSARRTPIMAVDSTVSFVSLPNESTRGYLLFSREGALLAQPFNVRQSRITGDPVVVAETVGSASFTGSAIRYAHFSASGSTLAYWQDTSQREQLFWFSRSGQRREMVGKPSNLGSFTLSPDRNHVAAVLGDIGQQSADLWLIDCQRGTQSRLTFARGLGGGSNPLFSRDGQTIAFASSRGGVNTIIQKSTSGTGAEEKLLESSNRLQLFDWSPDGRFLANGPLIRRSERGIWILPMAGDRKPFPYLNTPASESFARFSPDGKLIAYTSDEGRLAGGEASQIYVQPFAPESTNSRKWQISVNGGFGPYWRNDGKELFYFEGRKVMAVEIRTTGKNFEAGIPKELFEMPSGIVRTNPPMSADGQHFLLPVQVENEAAMPVSLVLNWIAGIQR
jgi:serine/threonine protein kinase